MTKKKRLRVAQPDVKRKTLELKTERQYTNASKSDFYWYVPRLKNFFDICAHQKSKIFTFSKETHISQTYAQSQKNNLDLVDIQLELWRIRIVKFTFPFNFLIYIFLNNDTLLFSLIQEELPASARKKSSQYMLYLLVPSARRPPKRHL